MLNNILSLTNVFIKTNFKSIFSSNTNNNKKGRKILRIILYIFLFVYLIGALSFLSVSILDTLIPMKLEGMFIGYVLTASFFFSLVTSIISSISINYFSDDNLSILPLPLKPMEVLASKVNTLLAYEYIENFILMVAPLVVYGIKTNQSFVYYILVLITLIVFPIIPTVIGTFIIMLIMSLTKGIRNKNIVQTFTMIISIAFAMSISFFSSNMSTMENPSIYIVQINMLINSFRKYFFTIGLGMDVLYENKILSLLILIVVSILFYVLLVLFGQKLYYRGMLGSLFSSAGISNKKIDERKAYNSKGLLFSYVSKELKTYLRKPVYLVQLIFPCVILPVFFLIIFYFSFSKGYGGDPKELFNLLFQNKEFERYIFVAMLLGVLFISMYSFLANVAISKDGKDACFMKYIPVSFATQVIYKMLPDMLMVLITYILVSISAIIVFGLPIKYFLISSIVIIPYSFTHSSLILTDLAKPKLTWNNEMQVVKSNFRIFYTIAFVILNIAVVAILGFYFRLEMIPMALVMSLIYLILTIIIVYYIYKKDIKLAKHIM